MEIVGIDLSTAITIDTCQGICMTNKINIISPCGFGDTLILCGFKEALEALYGASINFIIKPKHEIIMKMYDIEDYSIQDFSEDELYKIAEANPIPQKGSLFVAHPLFLNEKGLLDAFNKNKISFLNLHRKNLKLNDITEFKPPIKYPDLAKKFKQYIETLASLDKIVLIAPEAKSLKGINSHFFEELVKDLNSKGYTVISSVVDKCNMLKGSIYLPLNLEEAVALSMVCHSVYATRSGFCDLIAPVAKNLTVFYPDIQAYNAFNLRKIYNNSNISYLIVTHQITSGNFVSFITALIMLYTPIKNLGNNFTAVQFSFMAIERVFEVLDAEPTIKDRENAQILTSNYKGIELKGVNFEYTPNVPVLKNINIKIRKGETLALVGNSGGGKTTLVNLLPRFYDVTSGSIEIDGVDIKNYTLKSLRQNMAVVFQDNFLFSGTIRDNIMLGNENASEEDIQKAIKMAFLDEFIQELQNGINTYIGERGILLSGGQKQRVAIARAFLKDSPIIILDEATSALDNKAEAIVQKAIDNLMKDRTVFVIAHRLSTIQNADRIAVINEGALVELGTHSELISIKNGCYKALYYMQFKVQDEEIIQV